MISEQPRKVLIIGGVAGGATAAARLRRLSESTEIILFERGDFISFANCGLAYYLGGEIQEESALILQSPKSFRKRYNIDVRIRHEVTKIDPEAKTVTVKNIQNHEFYTESYDKLILSPGSKPVRPAGFESDKILTLRNIPDAIRIKNFIETQNPKNAIIIGGGYLGLEIAENLHRIGLRVTIILRDDHVLMPLDYDMACDVHRHIESKGVYLYRNQEIQSVTEKSGQIFVPIKLNGKSTEIAADMVILAIGVTPESVLAEDAGLAVNKQGCILVDEMLRTSDKNIYAVGDAIEVTDLVSGNKSFIPLAGPANKQGRIAADNICGLYSRYDGTQGSAILRVFEMTVATTGWNEMAAKRAGWNYEKVFLWLPNHAGYYPNATNMSIKVIFEKTSGKILGAEITGFDGVDKRCDIFATAIRSGMTAYDLTRLELCYAPPYSSAKDPVNIAGFVMENVLTDKMRLFHWHDVAALQESAKQPDTDIILLDVRTSGEYEKGKIDRFINIPLDELRKRINELDRQKKIYVMCQSGMRSYLAVRILMQNGFNAYNLSGGYRLYYSIFGVKKNS